MNELTLYGEDENPHESMQNLHYGYVYVVRKVVWTHFHYLLITFILREELFKFLKGSVGNDNPRSLFHGNV